MFDTAEALTVGWPTPRAFVVDRVLPQGHAPDEVQLLFVLLVNCHSQAANADGDSDSATSANAACRAAIFLVFICCLPPVFRSDQDLSKCRAEDFLRILIITLSVWPRPAPVRL